MMEQGKQLVIKVEDLHKHYRLGVTGATQLNDEIRALVARVRGRTDPRHSVDEEGRGMNTKKDFWALRGVDFQVRQGETLGIIGRNGAGKSTLLKLLSRITLPTKGSIKLRGRISSLLEVGTGFHQELTGMENIYLNGAILGMRKHEIKAKLDEIIAFSGIEHHIDTPLKRYSSGMKVRLGFAVAAHLEPEILIVDEVLAVGDADFQKKCLGKMRDVSSNDGRTILFVSHSMAAVKSLCERTIVLEKGRVKYEGETASAINYYMKGDSETMNRRHFGEEFNTPEIHVQEIRLQGEGHEPEVPLDEFQAIELHVICNIKRNADRRRLIFRLNSEEGVTIFAFSHARAGVPLKDGINHLVCSLPKGFLNIGSYYLTMLLVEDPATLIMQVDDIMNFHVQEGPRALGAWMGRRAGYIKPEFPWRQEPVLADITL
jgi:lipopolysaccharide transport system ATP-binding protein